MSVLNALTIVRDVAAVFLMLSVAALAFSLFSGAAFTTGVLGSIVAATLSGLAALTVYGLVTGLLGASPLAAAALTVAMVLGVLAVGAQSYGARGAWLGLMAVLGAAGGWLFIWVFMRELAGPAALAGPMAAFVAVSLLTTAAFAASVRVAEDRLAAEPSQGALRLAGRVFGPAPSWFDCTYSRMTGAQAESGRCAFNPPQVEGENAVAGLAPSARIAARPAPIDRAPDAAPDGDVEIAEAPARGDAPDMPSIEVPDFAPLGRGREDVAPPLPRALGDATSAIETADAGAADEPDAPARSPAPRLTADRAPDLQPGERPEEPAAPRAQPPLTEVAALKAPAAVDALQGGAPARDVERRRTEFVCFPMMGALAEQLCPDQRLTERDFEVSWLTPGGQTLAAAEDVECYYDAEAPLHMTLVANLSGELVGTVRRGGDATSRVRKADALYDVVARIIGAARAAARGEDAEDGAARERLLLSLFVANGSRLKSPWAGRELGPRKIDRLFDVRASGQTLALLRRLRSETQDLRRETEAGDLAESLQEMLSTRPVVGAGSGQPLFVVLTDAAAAAKFDEGAGAEAAAELARIGAPFFSIEIGSATPSESMRRLADLTDGAAFATISAEGFNAVIDRVISRARSFCALRISAPETFFTEAALQVKLRREMVDGCRLEQIATVDCEGISRRQRIVRDDEDF